MILAFIPAWMVHRTPNVPVVPNVRVTVPDVMLPMSVTPRGGESKTMLCSTVELLVNDTTVPFGTVRLVG